MVLVEVLRRPRNEEITFPLSSRLIYPTAQLISPLGYPANISNFFKNGQIKFLTFPFKLILR